MKRITNPSPSAPAYFFNESAAFFDIETTGLSARGSILILIGLIYRKSDTDTWYITQWFNDDGESEIQIITDFFSFLAAFDTLIHYNGNTFDLPYIRKRCDILNIPCPLDNYKSIDLYQKIRPIAKYLRLASLKQQAIEQLLRIKRTEIINGKELVKLYFLYLKLQKPEQERSLLRHNYDDLTGMLSICSLMSYNNLIAGHFSLAVHLEENTFHIDLSLQESMPSLFIEKDYFTVILEQKHGQIIIPVYQDTLKYFYPNYKDYYFLPVEDTAIHKSIAAYVDPQYRQKAKADTCYTKKDGIFLPQLTPVFDPAYRKNYKDKISYMEITDELLHAKDLLHSYALSLLRTLF